MAGGPPKGGGWIPQRRGCPGRRAASLAAGLGREAERGRAGQSRRGGLAEFSARPGDRRVDPKGGDL